MSFAITPLGKPEPIEPETPKIHSDAYKHSIVGSTYQPERSILTQIDGTPTVAEYYNQFLGRDEEPTQFEPNGGPTYQSYSRIKQLVIIQDDGSYNNDTETGESSKSFSGWVAFDSTPIRHDVFIRDIGDGRAGLFAITEQPEIRNFTANKVYYITYQLVNILTNELFEQLNSRVVRELVYSRDSALHGGDSVVTSTTYDTAKKLFSWRETIARNLMAKYYWKTELTMVWNTTEDKTVYDPYLVNFITAVLEPNLRGNYPTINQFSTEYGGREFGVYGVINIWEILLKGDINLLSQCDNKAGLIDTSRLMSTRLYGNLRSSKIDLFVATDPETFRQFSRFWNMDNDIVEVGASNTPMTYLFTDGFYEGNPTEEFETIVYNALKHKLIDRDRLLKYCEQYFELNHREQIYHGAILLLLINLSRKLGGSL